MSILPKEFIEAQEEKKREGLPFYFPWKVSSFQPIKSEYDHYQDPLCEIPDEREPEPWEIED